MRHYMYVGFCLDKDLLNSRYGISWCLIFRGLTQHQLCFEIFTKVCIHFQLVIWLAVGTHLVYLNNVLAGRSVITSVVIMLLNHS